MNLNCKTLLRSRIYKEKARRMCEFYATKLRMTAPRAIEVRYSFPFTETTWPMIGLSTAEHSFMMAQLIVPTYMEFLDLFPNKDLVPEKLESEALHHDDAEALTGDAATDVDGVTREMKDAAESMSIDRQYHGMVCHNYMRVRHDYYEARESYLSKLVKVHDAIDLVLFAQYCVSNGIGMITKGEKANEFLLHALNQTYPVDPRTHKEISPYFTASDSTKVSIAQIMYDHSIFRIEKMGCPELTGLLELFYTESKTFPFEKYNLVNLKMDFAKLA